MSINKGLTTIEEVRNLYSKLYPKENNLNKIKLKCWLNHSESRHKNNNFPFSFFNYNNHTNIDFYIQQIQLNIINCDDIGGKEHCIQFLKNY